jgi:hypothetical protein
LLLKEQKRLDKLGKDEEIKRIDEIIYDIEDKVKVPLVSFESLSEIENLEEFEIIYEALDKAQISLENNRLMKAVSELNEAKFNLKDLKIGNKYIKEIDNKLRELRERLGRTPDKDDKKEELVDKKEERMDEKTWKIIDSIMKKESIDEITLERQYLPEIFDKGVYLYSVEDGLPILNPFIPMYLRSKGIITEHYGKLLKIKKIEITPEEAEKYLEKYKRWRGIPL